MTLGIKKQFLKLLERKNDNPSCKRIYYEKFLYTYHEGQTLLHWACTGNWIEMVRWLLEDNVDLEAKDKEKNTALQ